MFQELSIFSIIIKFFGKEVQKLSKEYVNEHLRRIKIQEMLRFNKKCKKNNILPPPIKSKRGYKIAQEI